MKSKISKIMMGMVTGILMVLLFNVKVQAAAANISVSSVSGTKGDTMTVTVSVSADEAAMGQVGISYDTRYLEYISDGTNGGVAGLVLSVLNDIPAGQTQTISLNFRLREAGTTTVSVADNTQILAVNAADPENAAMNINKTAGTVTINAASTASNDSHLSGLSVQAVTQNGESTNVVYSPSFSPDVYEYRADLAANVTRLVVATTLSDANATTKVSGTKIDPGNNRTVITVRAQDGSESQYILYTTRGTETTTEPTTSGESDTQPESTTGFDRTPKLIKDLGKYIIQDFTLTTIPEGFEESTAVYNGETIAVLKGISKPLTLICLADDAQGTNIGIYIYNEASGAINKMVNVISVQKMYTIIPTDDSYAGPEGYTQTSLEINGDTVKAWVKAADSEFYVVYAMNWNGETALYVYDTKEQTMQRFVEGNKSDTFEDEPEKEDDKYLLLKRQYDDLKKEYDSDHDKKNKVIGGLGIAIIVIVIGAVILFYRIKPVSGFKEEVDEDELEEIGGIEEERELKLDMVAQVNEMKAEKLAAQISKIMEDDSEHNENGEDDETVSKEPEDVGNIMNNSTELQESIENTQNLTDAEKTSGAEDIAVIEETENVESITEADTEEKETAGNTEVKDKEEGTLIDMEADEPFEIEFFDLDDENKN